jgi:tetratricopeptide (TPR) repeat protein
MAAISQSPLIGYGLENQHEVLVSFYNPDWSVYEDINTAPDRAHNLILDLLLEGGVVMLIIYIIFIVFILIRGIRYLIKGSSRKINWLLFFLVVGIVSYHFSLLFSFPIVETNVLFWLYIGTILMLINNYKKSIIVDFRKFKNIYFVLFIYFALVLGSFAVYFVIDNVNSLRADYYFKKAGANYIIKKDYIQMFNNYVLALNLNSKEEYYRWYYINDSMESLEKVDSDDYRKNVLNYIKTLRAIDEERKDNFPRLFVKAKVYTMLGKYEDKRYFKEAEGLYEKLISISPLFPDSYRSWGHMYYLSEDYEKAVTIYNTALLVLPDINNPYLNNTHRKLINNFRVDIYEKMILCYEKLNDVNSQRKYYQAIISINPYRLDVYKKIADLYYQQGDFDKAIWYNKRGYMLNPNDYAWPFAIALLYEERGDKEKALEYAERALELVPDNDKIQDFINDL